MICGIVLILVIGRPLQLSYVKKLFVYLFEFAHLQFNLHRPRFSLDYIWQGNGAFQSSSLQKHPRSDVTTVDYSDAIEDNALRKQAIQQEREAGNSLNLGLARVPMAERLWKGRLSQLLNLDAHVLSLNELCVERNLWQLFIYNCDHWWIGYRTCSSNL